MPPKPPRTKRTNPDRKITYIFGALLIIIGGTFIGYVTLNRNKDNQAILKLCQMCFDSNNKCELICHPDNAELIKSMCSLYAAGKDTKDCLDLNLSINAKTVEEVGAKLNACATNKSQTLDFKAIQATVSQQYRDAWNQTCLRSQIRELEGELRNIPNNLEATVHIPPSPYSVNTLNGHFKVSIPADLANRDDVTLSIAVKGQAIKDHYMSVKSFQAGDKIIDYNKIESSGHSLSTPLAVTQLPASQPVNAQSPDYCVANEPIDYINQAKCARGDYKEELVLKEQYEPGNIIAESTNENNVAYQNVNLRPTLYGTESNGNSIKHKDGAPPSFYEIRVSERCYFKGGYTHGGFYYFIDKGKTPINKNYRISFYAWSVNADGLSLRIQHSDGQGEVSSLSGTAMITKERKKFWWTGRLDTKQQNVPQRYLFGYLVDYPGRRPCAPDPDHPEQFSGRSFVIGNVRLETWPD